MSPDALLRKATALHQQGLLTEALRHYDQLLRQSRNNAQVQLQRGLALAALGRLPDALPALAAAARLAPQSRDALLFHANALRDLGQHEAAAEAYARLLALEPGHVDAWIDRGAALGALGWHTDALASFEQAAALQPDNFLAQFNRANALKTVRRLGDALDGYARCIALAPSDPRPHHSRGDTLRAMGRMDEAIAAYGAAIAAAPAFTPSLVSCASLMLDQGRAEEARALIEHALATGTGSAPLHNLHGLTLKALGDLGSALACFEAAIALDPDLADAHANRGTAMMTLGHLVEALASLDRAVTLAPEQAEIHANRGGVLNDLGRLREANAAFDRANALNPDLPHLREHRLRARMQLCDWEKFDEEAAALRTTLERGGPAGLPLQLLTLFDAPPLLHRATAIDTSAGQAAVIAARPAANRPLRIGYVSADFRQHPLMQLVAEMLERHDRQAVTLSAYSFGPDTGDAWRRRAEQAVDRFHDIAALGDSDALALLRADEIDIAVDLTGLTRGHRFPLFAARFAPVQASYLGYMGTMNSPAIDYLIADPILVPPQERPHYSEAIAFLPGCYQVNCSIGIPAGAAGSRADHGLPDGAFVFGCFNNHAKILPALFAVWMEILSAVPGSCLWLWVPQQEAQEELRGAARRHGIDPDRLVFAPTVAVEAHLARLGHCDLFLDTLPYNAGTTASDTLRAGVPIVTCTGRSCVSRMATSLLHAVGLPELATPSLADYRALAIALARDPQRLADIRTQLHTGVQNGPLFDTARTTGQIEALYRMMHERAASGLAPADLQLTD